jgi:hypothetical protein
MDAFATVLQRVRRHGRDQVDVNFDDYSSGDETEIPHEALVRDATATVAAAAARVRERGGSELAASFAENVSQKGGRPSWRPVTARVGCDAYPGRKAQFRVSSGDDQMNVSAGVFGYFVALLYVASFRQLTADVYTYITRTADLERNFELAKACVRNGP